MQPFTIHTGIVAPLDRANVDTDMIIPKQFLKKTEKAGFGKHLFHEMRYLDYEGTKENPDFVLNKEACRKATILLARDNFGCGSSREHAPWALADFGFGKTRPYEFHVRHHHFRCVIAPGFADIFYNNCSKNGILLVRLKTDEVEVLFKEVAAKSGAEMTADLPEQKVVSPTGKEYRFDISPFFKDCLIKGLDHIGWTLQFGKQIEAHEMKIKATMPWLV